MKLKIVQLDETINMMSFTTHNIINEERGKGMRSEKTIMEI
jgi:hypothetical protein